MAREIHCQPTDRITKKYRQELYKMLFYIPAEHLRLCEVAPPIYT